MEERGGKTRHNLTMPLAIIFLQHTLTAKWILDIKRETLKHKLLEALFIYRDRPVLNENSERESIVKYL